MCRTKVVQHGAFSGPLATEFTRHEAFAGSPAKNFARQGASTDVSAKKFARQAIERHLWGIFRALGELFRAHTHHQTKQGELCTTRGAGVGTKLSRLAASASPTGTKLSQHARNTHFRRILRQQGEFCIAFTTNRPHRANKVTHQHAPRPTNAPLPQFRMQFDCMKLQQCSETLQFQHHKFIV